MDPHDNLLNQAGGDPAHIRQLYDDWAGDYDRDLANWGYEAPVVASGKLRALADDPAAPVLDAGCGTGLTGRALQTAGFQTIDGIDLSEDSLAIAARTGIYRHLLPVDFSALPSPLEAGAYGAVFCVGVMSYLPDTEGVCREFCRLAQRGAPLVLTQRTDLFDARGDAKAFARLEAEGLLQIEEVTEPMPYLPGNPDFDGVGIRYCSFRRA